MDRGALEDKCWGEGEMDIPGVRPFVGNSFVFTVGYLARSIVGTPSRNFCHLCTLVVEERSGCA